MERIALIIRQTDQDYARVDAVGKRRHDGALVISPHMCDLPLVSSGKLIADFTLHNALSDSLLPWQTYAKLAIINNPQIFERRQHSPHLGLKKQLQRRKETSNLVCEKWIEIRLGVRLSAASLRTGEPGELLTGRRAQHYVRSHLRIRLGKLEIVSAHLRGDPNAGIVHSTYKATPFANGGTVTYVD